MLNPISTYRIQFHKDFTFTDFELIIPYLQQLGVSTIYASPIFEAIPGSMHGYDIVNPHHINPEIGTADELRAISKRLKTAGISWVQDIVPNHMAFHPKNPWLMDVLEKGAASKYAGYFDINWSGPKDSPLMVPFLGTTLEEAIANSELELVNTGERIFLKYSDQLWPVNDAVTGVDMPLKEAIDAQYYRLCHWKETNYKINFRRFFTVNGLICLNMQHQETFNDYHYLVKAFLDEGIFDGLRVDHIDGLYDPEGYFQQLRKLAGNNTYIIIEKILEEGENIPHSWPLEGNTGYDFLARVNNLFTDQSSEKEFTRYYEKLTGDDKTIERQITEKKAAILQDSMAGELDNLYQLFLDLNLADAHTLLALKPGAMKETIGQLLIHCPVYRFYGSELPLTGENRKGLKDLINKIKKIAPLKDAALVLKKVLIETPEKAEKDFNISALQFYLRCMQFSGPLMAKGVEDTLMYTFNRFIGHNEVGDAPDAFGADVKVIHNWMWIRQNESPFSLNATATHDTKRGEDVRARLNVLSSMPAEWAHAVNTWRILNAELTEVLDPADEYFIYQTLIGSYPMPGMPDDNYGVRLQAYLEKALREGKKNSGWAEPNIAYEEAAQDFALRLLDPAADFWESFKALHLRVSNFGIINSLAQLLLKFTCPGVPDVYQGTELWDLSLVDPDNRRPVDYEQREKWLNEVTDTKVFIQDLWDERFGGKIKLLLQNILLGQRKLYPEIFASGAYIPLEVKGKYADQVFAFARRLDTEWLITAVPLSLLKTTEGKEDQFLTHDWKDTQIVRPAGTPLAWNNLLTGKSGKNRKLMLNDIFSGFPLALLKMNQPENKRSAGVLMHITSLPSVYGIGDFGMEARSFIDFLSRSGQKYWQLLPLNPIHEDQAYSPYSSVSSMAGNMLLISPELLVNDGLLEEKQLKKYKLPVKDELDFKKVTEQKDKLLRVVYDNFTSGAFWRMKIDFDNFCQKEGSWLNDFALFMVLRSLNNYLPWYKWDKQIIDVSAEALEFVKWQQFIFFRQWAALKNYAAVNGIKFYGDLPFYLGYDSVEVWSKRELFSVNSKGEMIGVAGVPPDYFNADGQLWGMPVYNWDQMKASGYQWWIARIRKNMELYDLLRLDHFRAFADYWEVPAGETTAIKGNWKIGPGNDFMLVLEKEFPDLPFIAEDLGEISEAVYELRDRFKFAGMKVLQFAFDKDMVRSEHIPYRFESDNFVVYTGTHDNDTSVGWFENSASKLEKKQLEQYSGQAVDRKNVHTILAQIAYGSIAKIVILPMQDILGLGAYARMNKPASVGINWKWKLKVMPSVEEEKLLKKLVKIYGRA